MDDVPGGNPYAPTTSALEDKGPPTRFVLGCVVLLHAFWCSFVVFYDVSHLRMPEPRSPPTSTLWTVAVVAALYAFTTYRLWRRQRWAWFVCWIPVLGASVISSFFLYFVLAAKWGRPLVTADWVLLSFFLVPSALLIPLQWALRREL